MTRAVPVSRTTSAHLDEPQSAEDHRPWFALAAALAGLAGAIAEIVPHGTLRLVLLLALVMVGPGAALVAFFPIRDATVCWALTLAGSLSITCFAAVLTFWTHVWNPVATLSVLAIVSAAAGIGECAYLLKTAHELTFHLEPPQSIRSLTSVLPLLGLVASVVLWAVALSRLRPSGVGPYGFSAALGPLFVAGMVVFGLGFAAEMAGQRRALVLAAYVLVVPLVMQATVPLLDGTIEYAWTYKHIGVVDLIRDYGHIIDSSDIYQQWPGFFALVALVSKVSHVDGLSFAGWASLTFGLVNMVMTAALLRQFTRDRRVLVLGVFLSQACMWVDIGYFSPQAYAYSLMLAFLVVVMRWLVRAPQPWTAGPGWIRALHAWLVRDMPKPRESTPRTRMYAGIAATGIYAAITVSHQLTPIVMMLPVFAIALVGVLRPWWLVLVWTGVASAFVGPRLGSVSSQYSIFSFDLLANASGNESTWNTPQQEFSAYVSRVLALGLWAVALLVLWTARKRLGTVLVAGLFAYLPILTLAGGSYGGEAIYRVFAFSLPFTALLCATLWRQAFWETAVRFPSKIYGRKAATELLETKPAQQERVTKHPSLMIGSGVLMAAIVLAGLQGLQGQLIVHQMTRTDIRAAEYFYRHAEPDSALILIAPNFPSKLRANYGSFNKGHVSVDISLVGDPTFKDNLGAARLGTIETYVRNLHYSPNYLVVSYAMQRYTNYFGNEPANWLTSLQGALDKSSNWTVFYRADGVAIYKLKS